MIYTILGILICIVAISYQLPKIKKGFLKGVSSKNIFDIDNDPRISKLDKEMGDLNRNAAERIRNNPEMLNLFKKAGIEITGGYGDNNIHSKTHNIETHVPSRTELLTSKYGEITAKKIIHKEVWIDMSSDELIESRRKPNHIEKEITKDTIKETWIYGNKVSGSYFELENGLVVKIVDR
jgi:hypothetical protein